MPDINVVDKKTFEELFKAIRKIPTIRTVKLADYGLVEPESAHGATWMQPKVVIVASAFYRDEKTGVPTILRWEEKKKAKQTVIVWAGKEHATHQEGDLVAKRELLQNRLELEGYQVSEGEWTKENVSEILNS